MPKRRWLIPATVALAIVFVYLSLFIFPATPRLLPGDQFINFDDARRMADGQTLYRDIFQYTLPGTELLELPLIKIFGAKLAVLNGLVFAAGIAETLIGLSMASVLLSGWDIALAVLFFLCFGFHCGLDATHHKFSVLFAYAAVAIILRRRSTVRLIGAGTLLGLATAFTQTRALVALAIAGFIAWENGRKTPEERHLLRDEAALLGPFAVLTGLACAYVIWNAGFSDFFRYIIRFPLLFYREGNGNSWGKVFPDWFPTPRGLLEWTIVKLLVPGTYLAFIVYCWRAWKRRGERPPIETVLLAVFGISLFATVVYAPLHVRLAGMSLPAIILAIWMLNRSLNGLWRVPAWGAAGAFLLFATLNTQFQPYWYYDTAAGRIATSDKEMYAELAWLDKHTDPGDTFFSPGSPALYVLLDLRNPARVPFIEPDDYTRPRQVTFTLRRLQQERPRYVLWPFPRDNADDPQDQLFLIGEQLRSHYRPLVSLRDGDLWERKDFAQADERSKSGPGGTQ